jgi:hypothetical protein
MSSQYQGRISDFSAGGAKGEAQVVKASTKSAKPRAVVWGGVPQKIFKSWMLRGVFPPSQKLKDIPTKCTRFCRKNLTSDKKAI